MPCAAGHRNGIAWKLFDNADTMACAVADAVESIIKCAIEVHGSAVLALPGGTTPVPIFRELANRNLNWSGVTLLPTDDRLVPIDHVLSNAGLIRRFFGSTEARLVTLLDDDDGIDTVGYSASRTLRTLRWPLDLVWLGMGEDGHTASILPGPDFEAALNRSSEHRACSVVPDPMPLEAAVARITLTRAALVATRCLILTITGEKKRLVAERAFREGCASTVAIGRVVAWAQAPAVVFWCK
nr:6-phosphogluconolactonase [Sphingobium indicum]